METPSLPSSLARSGRAFWPALRSGLYLCHVAMRAMSGPVELSCGCRNHATVRVDPDPYLQTGPTTDQAVSWQIRDEVSQLREWGTDIVHPLPARSHVVDGSDALLERLSREHVRLERRGRGWLVRDNGATNGLRADGVRRPEVRLEPAVEIDVGGVRLLAENHHLIKLRAFLGRLLGWTADRLVAVDVALRAIRLAASGRFPLVLSGAGNLMHVAHALHTYALGDGRPFVVSDPRRREGRRTVRVAENAETGMAAVARANGGSLCVLCNRLPADFDEVRVALRDPTVAVQLIVCLNEPLRFKPHHIEAIDIPALETRSAEVARIVAEYAEDSAAEFGATARLGDADQGWVLQHSAASVSEIEKGVRRLAALRQHNDNVTAAAKVLGMARISLFRWFARRELPAAVCARPYRRRDRRTAVQA